jgi:hypothetical protein
MIHAVFIAAAAGETAAGAVAIDFQTALLLVVVACLAFMARALADLGQRVRELAAARAGPAPAAPGATAPSPPASAREPGAGHLAPELMAVIAAAVHVASEHPVRIVAVDEAKHAPSATWSLEGRRQIFSSHRVR